MEGSIMPMPAVADILTKHFIEVRIHTDHPDAEIEKRNDDLQLELQGDVSLPYYMVINPETNDVYGTYAGASLQIQSFVDFLAAGVKKSEASRVAQAD